MRINVFDTYGNIVEYVEIPTDELTQVKNRRVMKDSKGFFYKGAGCDYKYHQKETLLPWETIIKDRPLPYVPYLVQNMRWRGKRGIFKTPYQLYFSDYVGGCGPKEQKIEENSTLIPFSGARVLDRYDILDCHSIYKIEYFGEDDSPSVKGLSYLIEGIINNDWCCPWDKNLIRDIDSRGLVRDPSDWFKSKKFIHKLGTVYALFYSLHQEDRTLYLELMKALELSPVPHIFMIVGNTAAILQRHMVLPSDFGKGRDEREIYFNILLDWLTEGKLCCQLEHPEQYEYVKGIHKEAVIRAKEERSS